MTGGGGQVGQRTIYEVNYQRKKQSPTTQGGSCHSSALLQDRGRAGEQEITETSKVSQTLISRPLCWQNPPILLMAEIPVRSICIL